MKMTFRWYGEKDCIPLDYIKQIQGMTGVVTAVYDVPVGEVWPLERLLAMKALCEKLGVSVSEAILYDDTLASIKAAKDAGLSVYGIYDVSSYSETEEIKKNSVGYYKSIEEIEL